MARSRTLISPFIPLLNIFNFNLFHHFFKKKELFKQFRQTVPTNWIELHGGSIKLTKLQGKKKANVDRWPEERLIITHTHRGGRKVSLIRHWWRGGPLASGDPPAGKRYGPESIQWPRFFCVNLFLLVLLFLLHFFLSIPVDFLGDLFSYFASLWRFTTPFFVSWTPSNC